MGKIRETVARGRGDMWDHFEISRPRVTFFSFPSVHQSDTGISLDFTKWKKWAWDIWNLCEIVRPRVTLLFPPFVHRNDTGTSLVFTYLGKIHREMWIEKEPTATEKSNEQRDNTKTPRKSSITRVRTDIGRSVGVTTSTNSYWCG